LKSGGEYRAEHVRALHSQLLKYADEEVILLSDVDVQGIERIPLKLNLPGWWSKIELFRPELSGEILYLDLDTVVVGEMRDILRINKLTFVRDFYRDGVRRPTGMQSCMMYLPEDLRAEAWAHWHPNLVAHYKRRGVGDQAFMEDLWLGEAAYFQDIVPGQIVSYKVHCKQGLPPDARVVCGHGKPKPWSPEWRL
jgi:hypothetical protein